MLRHLLLVACTLGLASCASQARLEHPDRSCEVHDSPLIGERVRVIYGLPLEAGDRDFGRDKLEHFPNANRFAWGGCCVDGTGRIYQPKYADIQYCPECRKLYDERWKQLLQKLRRESQKAEAPN